MMSKRPKEGVKVPSALRDELADMEDRIGKILGPRTSLEFKENKNESASKSKEQAETETLTNYKNAIESQIKGMKKRLTDEPDKVRPKDVLAFFNACQKSSEQAIGELKSVRELGTFFLDILKSIGNFCISLVKYLGFAKDSKFFTTTATPVEEVQEVVQDIKESLETFAKANQNTDDFQPRMEGFNS